MTDMLEGIIRDIKSLLKRVSHLETRPNPIGDDLYLRADDSAIYFGVASDVNLYRSAANVLKTDDTFIVGTDVHIQSDVPGLGRRMLYGQAPNSAYMEKFDSDPGWTWAGAPFTTPYAENYIMSHAYISMSSTSSTPGPRSFLYQSAHMPAGSLIATLKLNAGGTNTGVGIRMDDGSDTNFVEVFIAYTGTAMQYRIRKRHQIGGGGIVVVDAAYNLLVPDLIMYASISGTRWSSWGFEPILQLPGAIYGVARCGIGISGLTWTPTRVGLVWNKADADASTWYTGYVDWFYYN